MTMTSSDRKVEEESQTDNEDGDEDEDGDGNYHKNQLTRFHSLKETRSRRPSKMKYSMSIMVLDRDFDLTNENLIFE